MAQSVRLQSVNPVSSNLTPSSKFPLVLSCRRYYLYGMREQFEITTTSDLTEVRDSERVRYMLNDGDTMLTLSTNDPSITEKLLVSKYRNASVKITITVEHDNMEYKDIQP